MDVEFSSNHDQLSNISVGMNHTVQIKIPTESLVSDSIESTNSETGS